MARKLRPQAEGMTYHITIRGVAGLPIYLGDPDRERFLWIVEDVVRDFGWVCHAYCLMRTHYHLLLRTPEANIGVGMKHLNGVYAQGFNRRYGRFGHVFAHRYESVVVETEAQLLEEFRYIVLNPVRAGACARPEQWPWSSYRAALGFELTPPWLNTGWLVSLFGPDKRRARGRFAEFVMAGLQERVVTRS